MNAHALSQVDVLLDLERLSGPQRMGVLHRQTARSGDVYSFLDNSPLNAAPPLTSLHELQATAGVLEDDRDPSAASLRTVLEPRTPEIVRWIDDLHK